jgi:hypothetical protein
MVLNLLKPKINIPPTCAHALSYVSANSEAIISMLDYSLILRGGESILSTFYHF